MTRQEAIKDNILRPLEILCAIFFAFLGSAAMVLAAQTTIHLIGELLWRFPRGEAYLHWDLLLMTGLFAVSAAMFSAAFLITANAFWDRRWSRRVVILTISFAMTGFCAFVVSMMMLGAGLAQID